MDEQEQVRQDVLSPQSKLPRHSHSVSIGAFVFSVALVFLIGGIGGFFLGAKKIYAPNPTPSPTAPSGIFCTQEAKQCPDGSYVSRHGPQCEFDACADSKQSSTSSNVKGWISYQDPQNKFSLQYPPELRKGVFNGSEGETGVGFSYIGPTQIASGRTQTELFDGYSLTIIPIAKTTDSLQEVATKAYAKQKEDESVQKITAPTKTTIGKFSGYSFTYEGFGSAEVIFLEGRTTLIKMYLVVEGSNQLQATYRKQAEELIGTLSIN